MDGGSSSKAAKIDGVQVPHNMGLAIMKTLAQRLRCARKRSRLTQYQLAREAGTTQQNIQNIEAGLVRRPRKIVAIARAVGNSPAWLQFGVDDNDRLDADAFALARAWMELEEPYRSALRNAILDIAKARPRKK